MIEYQITDIRLDFLLQFPLDFNMESDKKNRSEIRSPESSSLKELCASLHQLAIDLETPEKNEFYRWPQPQLDLCAKYGVFKWFLEKRYGGFGWSDQELTLGYLALGSACQTTTFVITQRTGACQRIAQSDNEYVRNQLLPVLLEGTHFSTVGISHLTTSKRYLDQPVLRAIETQKGFILNGFTPWVTGATQADTIVVGAECEDGRQILIVVPTHISGIKIAPPNQLVSFSSSQTSRVSFEQVEVDAKWLLAGPTQNVLSQGIGTRTGGYQTCTLALGLAGAAIEFILSECQIRKDIIPPAKALKSQWIELKKKLLDSVSGREVVSTEYLRQQCNSLVLRATQSSLVVAKGTGFLAGHPAGRWCREALFFMVWSCPQSVINRQLYQFSRDYDGLNDEAAEATQ